MQSIKKNICWSKSNHDLFLDIFNEFAKLDRQQKRRFIERNGFNPSRYKDFVESSVMVFTHLAEELEDIYYKDGRFHIRQSNLKGDGSILDKLDKNVLVSLPRKWKIEEWEANYFSQSDQG